MDENKKLHREVVELHKKIKELRFELGMNIKESKEANELHKAELDKAKLITETEKTARLVAERALKVATLSKDEIHCDLLCAKNEALAQTRIIQAKEAEIVRLFELQKNTEAARIKLQEELTSSQFSANEKDGFSNSANPSSRRRNR